MDHRLIIGFLLFTAAQTVAWYQLNSQFVWEFWKGTKNIYEASDALWPSRFLAFSSGMIVFTSLTWIHLNESPFTLKTTLCIILACMIIAIQVFMK